MIAVSAFLRFEGVDGESAQKGHEQWIEVLAWDWEIEAESSWAQGGGASVGKPQPGALTWTHRFDRASIALMGRLASGQLLSRAELHLARRSEIRSSDTYLSAVMDGILLTRIATTGAEDGSTVQQVSMVFREISIDYRSQDRAGRLGDPVRFSWDIPAGVASPSS